MILGSNWFRITKKHCQTVSVKYIYLTLWCHWHPPSLTPRCRWLCGVYDSEVSMTPRCLWHCGVYDSAVSMTLWCLWLRGVYDTVVSMTPRCLCHCGVYDSEVSMTLWCLMHTQKSPQKWDHLQNYFGKWIWLRMVRIMKNLGTQNTVLSGFSKFYAVIPVLLSISIFLPY